jgi:hypothetical protein
MRLFGIEVFMFIGTVEFGVDVDVVGGGRFTGGQRAEHPRQPSVCSGVR